MSRCLLFVGAALCITSGASAAYELETHALLSQSAAERSVLNQSATIMQLGLGQPINSQSQRFPRSDGEVRSILDLIGDGARFEDDSYRTVFHFFNPITGQGLLGVATSSPDWALQDRGTSTLQNFSYRDARLYFFQALTDPDNVSRRKRFGALFQSIGQIVHHLQDMAQPQHVRDDPHLLLSGGTQAILCAVLGDIVCFGIRSHISPSQYESYTEKFLDRVIPDAPYPAVYAINDTTTFATPRQFWQNSGKGMAEYTNRGFVSSGTNFAGPLKSISSAPGFDLPDGAAASLEPVTGLKLRLELNCAGDPLPQSIRDDDELWFIGTSVTDLYTNISTPNPRTSTYSIFDADLERRGKGKVFSLNRFNHCAAQALLLPRAVGYSTGLINYFFRGQLAVSLPDDGVYAVVNHTGDVKSPSTCGSPCGFRKLKLMVKNTTPTDDIGSGIVVAVAKYHLNNCYQLDLSGDFGAPAFAGSACRSIDESIVVSNSKTVETLDRSPQTLEFTFPDATPIPINAVDLYLQIIFKGKLGQEDDGIALTTIDAHEPTYLIFGNHTDYQAVYNYDGTFSRADSVPPEAFNIEVRFNPDRPNPTASSTPLYSGSFNRIAILTDKETIDYWLLEHEISGHTSTQEWSFNATVNQTDSQNQTRNVPSYVPLRRTTASDWAYMPNLPGAVIYWNWGFWCVDRTNNCAPVDKTNDAWVRHFPPFREPSATPMVIDF